MVAVVVLCGGSFVQLKERDKQPPPVLSPPQPPGSILFLDLPCPTKPTTKLMLEILSNYGAREVQLGTIVPYAMAPSPA